MITPEQREARRKHLGSSDAAGVLGINPYGYNQDSVYWSKVLPPSDDVPTAAMQTGNRLEKPLVQFACEQLGVSALTDAFQVSVGPDGGILAANFDALIREKPEAIEAKYVGPLHAAEWGSEGTDEVAEHVIVQCQHQMYVGHLERVWVPAFVVFSYEPVWRLYCVPRNDELIDALVDAECKFWANHVVPKIPPTDAPPPLAMLKALRRQPESIVELDESAVEAWGEREIYSDVKSQAEKDYDEATAAVLQMLGEAEAGRLPDGSMIWYRQENAGARCDTKALKLKFPDAYAATCTETKRRVLRLKTEKKAKV
jgi:putative phage-type endonuclease